ncbi:LysR family transcriptional regulator [Achromobacter aloeverae]|uniref:LysR family transcriptional regulator n=1 Tax=Achromobacter aloeverae TaxID=1750518 RepID=A0A4Q1HKK2_9BURK|nr:LysR family transcriptional regulator [Achromobacter aloeverae]RXN87815.1 LysR family transcriptional regulator [Achromobacter aloeverae]
MTELKLFEDLIALARTGSFVRAADLRHVTHPAFGRRIKALEAWAGTPLILHQRAPVTLTPAGEQLLKAATQAVEQMEQVRQRIARAEGAERVLRIATGRSLARTMVTEWIARLCRQRVIDNHDHVDLATGMISTMVTQLENGEADLLCCYEHPAWSASLGSGRYRYLTFAIDKLVPVSQTDAHGKPRHSLGDARRPPPLIASAEGLAMGNILGDWLKRSPHALRPFLRCDSLDAIHGAALKGLGIAWLPWSMVAGDCARGVLGKLGGRGDEVTFEVRLYRPRTRLSELAEAAWSAAEAA